MSSYLLSGIAIALATFTSNVAASPNSATTDAVDTAASAPSTPQKPKSARFEGRPDARIAFTRQIRNFKITREDNDDVLYLETLRDKWYRSAIFCSGIADPRDAHGIASIDHGFGVDGHSRIALVYLGQHPTQCTLRRLVELTPDEAVELRLVRHQRRNAPRSSS